MDTKRNRHGLIKRQWLAPAVVMLLATSAWSGAFAQTGGLGSDSGGSSPPPSLSPTGPLVPSNGGGLGTSISPGTGGVGEGLSAPSSGTSAVPSNETGVGQEPIGTPCASGAVVTPSTSAASTTVGRACR